jgi:hypothetical protein
MPSSYTIPALVEAIVKYFSKRDTEAREHAETK